MAARCPLSCTCELCIEVPKPDSDEEGEAQVVQAAKKAKKEKERGLPQQPQRTWSALETILGFSFVDDGPNHTLVKALRRCEKYEIACQGDDHADKDKPTFNSQASLGPELTPAPELTPDWRTALAQAMHYARAAAAVAGQRCLWRKRERVGSEKSFKQWLTTLPWIQEPRAFQILQFMNTGTFEALASLESGRAPLSVTENLRRTVDDAGHSMLHAPQRLELGKVFGISSIRAIQLVDGTLVDRAGNPSGLRPVLSVAELRESPEHLEALRAHVVGADGVLTASLNHFEQLQQGVPVATAEAMRSTVLRIVRRHHSARVGATRDCPPPAEGAPPCRCCWHAEFMGGKRTKGRFGHDVDLLVWHHSEPNSWGEERTACVVCPLVAELEQLGVLLTKSEGRRTLIRRDHKKKQPDPLNGEKGYLKRPVISSQNVGIENLQGDWHDKVFGIWRTPEGMHHRIDIVVVNVPEELPFARLTWTGTRTLNRLMRLQAIQLGLNLNANGLLAREGPETRVVVEARPGHASREVVIHGHGHVPFEFCTTEEDIIRILARGTDHFVGLVDPRCRNA